MVAAHVTVLVVDDDPDYRLIVGLALEDPPGFCRVLEAANAADAVRLARDQSPDVVLLDVSLPGSVEIALGVGDTRLVLVSSRPADELAVLAAATSSVGYLGKDLAPSELPAAIDDFIRVSDRLGWVLAKASGRLPADARSSRQARHLVGETLGGWCGQEQLDDIALCVSELVTNAVVHTGSAPRVLVHVRSADIHVEISDDSDAFPELRDVGPDDTSGRGVSILEALSDRWGSRRRSGGGKTVWFNIIRSDDRGQAGER